MGWKLGNELVADVFSEARHEEDHAYVRIFYVTYDPVYCLCLLYVLLPLLRLGQMLHFIFGSQSILYYIFLTMVTAKPKLHVCDTSRVPKRQSV